jgi:uncharacterized protein (TIGR03083 family)
VDLWPITLRARQSLISTLEGVEDDRWDVGSLCEGWTIRQVLAHLILAARPPAGRYATAVLKARGDFDRANHLLAVAGAQRPPDQLLSEYRAVVAHRFSPPGWPAAAPLSDILLHSLDVRLPLGIETDEPGQHYEPVLDLLFSRFRRSFTSRGRPNVRWTAEDHAWSHGDGPEVRGAMQDLALTAAGRAARIDRLSGDGVAAVRAWLA